MIAREPVLKAIVFLAVLGVGISAYSFLHNQGFAAGEFCSLNETFDCDIVNKGPFSQFLGIPVALMGVFGYFIIGLAAYLKLREPSDLGVTVFLATSALAAFGFSVYLTSLEAFVLKTWCVVCLSSQAVIALIFAGSVWLLHYEHAGRKFKLDE